MNSAVIFLNVYRVPDIYNFNWKIVKIKILLVVVYAAAVTGSIC